MRQVLGRDAVLGVLEVERAQSLVQRIREEESKQAETSG